MLKTGRPRGVFRDFGVSRHVFEKWRINVVYPRNKIKLVKKYI
jgi:hypothetical protein